LSDKALTNLANAQKSTGPKTLAGKKASSKNALRHGLLSASPVLSTENEGAFRRHVASVREALAPVGYLETVLSERVAVLSWRLQRVTRFETGALENELASVDVGKAYGVTDVFSTFSFSMDQMAEEVALLEELAQSFRAVSESSGDIPKASAFAVLYALAEEAGVSLEELELAFLGEDDVESFGGWTRERLDEVVDLVISASKKKGVSLAACGAKACGLAMHARVVFDERTRAREHGLRATGLLDESTVERIARYESHLDRSLYRALHELERLQATRSGAPRPSMALDLDVSVGPRRNRFEDGP